MHWGKLGTIGGLVSIGLYLFEKTLNNLSDSEKICYSLINRTAISVAKEIMKEAEELMKDEHKTKNF
jgi:hypothetical protein